jgi:1-aminocyclopropane-1-carboxylate deaminase/D-cysteine desulfhydrase-like pyridoxal-dependent ACC family enzyme
LRWLKNKQETNIPYHPEAIEKALESFPNARISISPTPIHRLLLLGRCISEYETTIIGMAASQRSDVQRERIHQLALLTANRLGVRFEAAKIVVDDRFIGPGYAIASEAGKQAAKMFAVMEGVLLDDVYTGKAAAGLVHYAMNNMFREDDNVLFVHTGGNSGLFY